MRLRRDVTDAKHALSEHLAVQVLPDGFDDDIRVTRHEFESAIDQPLRESVDELLSTLTRAGVKPEELAALYLTGGSSRVPRISDLLAESLGALPAVSGDPKAAVVLGALATPQAAPAPMPLLAAETAATPGVVAARDGAGRPGAGPAAAAGRGHPPHRDPHRGPRPAGDAGRAR
jgi:cell division ATPase FtsA